TPTFASRARIGRRRGGPSMHAHRGSPQRMSSRIGSFNSATVILVISPVLSSGVPETLLRHAPAPDVDLLQVVGGHVHRAGELVPVFLVQDAFDQRLVQDQVHVGAVMALYGHQEPARLHRPGRVRHGAPPEPPRLCCGTVAVTLSSGADHTSAPGTSDYSRP